MSTARAVLLALAAMAIGVAGGRALPRATLAVAMPSAPPAAPDRSCQAERAELATTRGKLAICLAYARPSSEPAPAPATTAAPDEPAGAWSGTLDGLLAEAQKARARDEASRELVYLRYRDGRIRAYRPEDGPPDAGDLDGARITMRKLPDGTWERYDPPPHIVKLAGPPGPDGLVTMPDGRRVRYVFTDAGAP